MSTIFERVRDSWIINHFQYQEFSCIPWWITYQKWKMLKSFKDSTISTWLWRINNIVIIFNRVGYFQISCWVITNGSRTTRGIINSFTDWIPQEYKLTVKIKSYPSVST